MSHWPRAVVAVTLTVIAAAAFTVPRVEPEQNAQQPQQIARGRYLVISHACGECHGGGDNPAAKGWLAGSTGPETESRIGPPPCGLGVPATGCFTTRPRNLTPDNLTGLGRFTERQIFNALRYGLRPEDTPDLEITSSTPGKGNFPEHPHYLAPPMPWPVWRHMPDEDLRAIAAYLKHGLKPVRHKVADSEGPPDFWAGAYTENAIGAYPAAAYPTANERTVPATDRDLVLRGRYLVISHGCADCHRGPAPDSKGWLAGITEPSQDFVIGPCLADPAAKPCFHGRPSNITPDDATGIGRYTERQIFNALRYGLRPEHTPDVDITSSTPGQGNYPAAPDYLGPFMPWTSFRFMPDEDLHAIAAYLKRGLEPVSNKVPDSDRTPDLWASAVTAEAIGPYPPAPFPTANEVRVGIASAGGGR